VLLEQVVDAVAPVKGPRGQPGRPRRRLQVRYERRADLLTAFLQLACALICLKDPT
jgi:hypothetical protein